VEKRECFQLMRLPRFDMMWIAGVDWVVKRAGAAMTNDFDAAMVAQMNHVDWTGLHIIDFVLSSNA